MDIQKLLDFLDKEDKRLNEHYKTDPQTRILARTVKLMEELGELCDDVLSHGNLQRTEKLQKHEKEKIREEFADVVFTAILLAKAMNIDILKGVEEKMEKVKNRTY